MAKLPENTFMHSNISWHLTMLSKFSRTGPKYIYYSLDLELAFVQYHMLSNLLCSLIEFAAFELHSEEMEGIS